MSAGTAVHEPISPAAAPRVVCVEAWRPRDGDARANLAVEEPLEIRVNGAPVAVTMRTPGDDEDLAVGYLLSEGWIAGYHDVVEVSPGRGVRPGSEGNAVDVRLRESRHPAGAGSRRPRRGLLTSACGVCGEGTIEAVRRRAAPLSSRATMDADRLVAMPASLRRTQAVFAETGGLHAAGLFSLSGSLIVAREDVGRHNAVDKVVGHAVRCAMLPGLNVALMVSGRAGFEIVLKAWLAGIAIVASVSAPSSLAVEMAEEANITLVGFLRGSDYTVYSGLHRVSRRNNDA